MWMLRLLPGMTPGAEKPAKPEPKNKVILKPTAAVPPTNAEAEKIVAQHRDVIESLHKATSGRLDLIHQSFCSITEHNGKPPIPPQVMMRLLELTEEDIKEQPVTVSVVSLEKAFVKMVKPDDNIENYEKKVITVVRSQVERAQHAAVEIEKLKPAFKELHDLTKGKAKHLFAFFMELLPEEQRGQYNIEMWNAAVMKLPPKTEKIELDHFTNCFRDAMDSTDTADQILPKLQKHIDLHKGGKVPEAAAEPPAQSGPPGPPPPPSEEAVALVKEFEKEIVEFHAATGGRVSQIHTAFNVVAQANQRPRIPPQAMGALLELTKENLSKNPVIVSDAQVMKAFQKMVKPEDTKENFTTKVVEHIEKFTKRAEHQKQEIEILKPALTELHESCAGAAKSLFEFFMDLVPEDDRPNFSLEQWNGLVMKVHPKSEEIQLEQFILSFQDSIDEADNAAKIQPVLEKHVGRLKASPAAEGEEEKKEEDSKDEESKESEEAPSDEKQE